MRICFRCKISKPLAAFYRNRNTRDGATSYCKDCEKEYRKEYFLRPGKRALSRQGVIAYQKSIPNFKEEKRLYDIEYRKKNGARIIVWHKQFSERNRDKIFRQKYGITVADYDKMFEEQGGLCSICGNPPTNIRLAVDHCHSTGQVRGLLCTSCNHGLGHFKDDVSIITAAAAYLSQHGVANDCWRQKQSSNYVP